MYLKRVRIIAPKVTILPDPIQIFCIQTTQMYQKITKTTHHI